MTFTLPLPPPLNQTYRMWNGRYLKAKGAREWEKEAGYILLQNKPKIPLKLPLYVGIELFLKRDRDIDSSLKLPLDLMEEMGFYENDRQIWHLNVKKYVDKENPHMEIVLEESVLE